MPDEDPIPNAKLKWAIATAWWISATCHHRAAKQAAGAGSSGPSDVSTTLTLSANDPYVGRKPPTNRLIGPENLRQH